MGYNAKKTTLVALLAAIIVVIITYFSVPTEPYLPHGIYLPSTQTLSPVATSTVDLFTSESAPIGYKVLGRVNVMLHAVTPTPEGQMAVEQYAKKLAAKAGANGIIVTSFGHTLPQIPSAQGSYVLQGMAVYYVPNI